MEHPRVLDEGTILAAYAKEHIVIIPKDVPSFNTIQVVTAQVEQRGFALIVWI